MGRYAPPLQNTLLLFILFILKNIIRIRMEAMEAMEAMEGRNEMLLRKKGKGKKEGGRENDPPLPPASILLTSPIS